MELLTSPFEFEWDKHNIEHIGIKHKIEPGECEQIFFNIPLSIKPDATHSRFEERYFALGKTNAERLIVVIFTIRNKKIRIITARDASRRERRNHEKA